MDKNFKEEIKMGLFNFYKGKGKKILILQDPDGNKYNTIRIGKQVWTVENLRTTKYNDGTPIPHITDDKEWGSLSTPGYCYYDNSDDLEKNKRYGVLYNWYTIETGKLAPEGWHVPTDEEWITLRNYLLRKGFNVAKSLAAKIDWLDSTSSGAIGNDLASNNRSGFSALPGGFRVFNGFDSIGYYSFWWSATNHSLSEASYLYLHYDYDNELHRNVGSKESGNSVRLIKS